MLVFITGVAGSGKSTLCAALNAAGASAHDADAGISRHLSVSSGRPVDPPPREAQTPEWAAAHEYRFDLERVRSLAREFEDSAVFLLGAAFGDEEVIAMADRSFYLDVDEAELRRRLAARAEDAYGSAPHELESILSWHAVAADRYEALGAGRLDARRPAQEIADVLLRAPGISP